MTELGNKHECLGCSTKFYDLGKSELVCPKCGENQKDLAAAQDGSAGKEKKPRKKAAKKKAKNTKATKKKEAEAVQADEPATTDDEKASDKDSKDVAAKS
jgi:uncharacterized protein (TIGR02300 family)